MMADCGLGDHTSIRISEWKVKKRDIKNKLLKLERKEADVVKLYDDIMTAIFVRIGFFIAFASYLSGFYAKPYATFWMYTVMVVVILGFIFEVVFPIYSAWMHMRGLEDVIQKFVLTRKKLHVSCMNLLDDYDAIYLFTSKTRQHKDPFLKELREHELSRLEDFKKEDKVPKARKKFSRKFPLALGVFCMVYSIIVLLFVFYKSHNQPVLLPAPPSLHGPSTEHTLSKTIKGGLESSHRESVKSFEKEQRSQGGIIVRGFDTSGGEEQVQSALEEHFRFCGDISRLSIPKDDNGNLKGIAYMDFTDAYGLSKALQLDGSELGEDTLMVAETNPRDNNFDICGGTIRDRGRSVVERRFSGGGCGSSGGSGSCFVGRLGDRCPGIVD